MSISTYVVVYQQGMARTLAYGVDYLLQAVSLIALVLIQLFVWRAVFESGGQEHFGYTLREISLYTICAGLMFRLIATDFQRVLAEEIRMGSLGRFLRLPISLLLYNLVSFFGEKTPEVFLLGGVLMLALFFTGIPPSEFIVRVIYALPAILIALFLVFFLFYAVAASALWLTDAWALFLFLGQIQFVFTGASIPVQVFGPAFGEVSRYLPFQYMVYQPVQILMGKLPDAEWMPGLIIASLWTVVFALLSLGLWNRGFKRWVAVGG